MIWYHRPYNFNSQSLWGIGPLSKVTNGILQVHGDHALRKFDLKLWGPHSIAIPGFEKDNKHWIRVVKE